MAEKRYADPTWTNAPTAYFSDNFYDGAVQVFVYTAAEHEQAQKLRALYVSVNTMMAALGKHGEMSDEVILEYYAYNTTNAVDFARAVIAAHEAKRWLPIAEAPKNRRVLVRGDTGFVNAAAQIYNFTEEKWEWAVAEIGFGKGSGTTLLFDNPIEWAEIPGSPLPEPPEKQG